MGLIRIFMGNPMESNGGFFFGGITGGTWFILVLPTFFTGLD
jgi:hypothetical protein